VPKISLRLEDVAYLRSLSGPNKIKCAIHDNRLRRLRILGLVEDAEIPATPATVADADKKINEFKLKVQRAFETENWWDNLPDAYLIRREWQRKQPSTGPVITELGRSLLATGEVTVKLSKKGCL
jgi:hypothetical protein